MVLACNYDHFYKNTTTTSNATTANTYQGQHHHRLIIIRFTNRASKTIKRCEYLRENEVKALCLRAREILVDEGSVQRVDAPVTVCFCIYDVIYYCFILVYCRLCSPFTHILSLQMNLQHTYSTTRKD